MKRTLHEQDVRGRTRQPAADYRLNTWLGRAFVVLLAVMFFAATLLFDVFILSAALVAVLVSALLLAARRGFRRVSPGTSRAAAIDLSKSDYEVVETLNGESDAVRKVRDER